MKKSTFKLYLATFVFTLTLTTFTFAGDGQCPIAPPPPGRPDGEVVTVNTNPSVRSSYQFLKSFWDLLAQSTDLF